MLVVALLRHGQTFHVCLDPFRNERHLTHLCGLGTGPRQTQPSPPGKEESRKTGCSRNDALKL
jgi:hypothetical protein